MKKPIVTVIVILLIVIAAVLIIAAQMNTQSANEPIVSNNNSTETPATTTQQFTGNDKIKIFLAKDAVVKSPLVITGEARGSWYFEAVFGVKILDANDTVIGQGYVTAQDEWMTVDFVPFKGELTFSQPLTTTGTLVFQNDNPSGLPENSVEFRMPVKFEQGKVETTKVSLYYQNAKKAQEIGDNCSADSIQPLVREVPKSKTPIQYTINLLITRTLTANEKAAGFQTEFPRAGFKLLGANLKNGTLTLEFTEVPGFTTGGACRMTILSQQIIKTAKQFSGVNNVVFKPVELFQP